MGLKAGTRARAHVRRRRLGRARLLVMAFFPLATISYVVLLYWQKLGWIASRRRRVCEWRGLGFHISFRAVGIRDGSGGAIFPLTHILAGKHAKYVP